ncbi:MAG: toll/interleukin receptor protein [Mucilaginibacter sp.]|nr:toll/interleukin receptor protein [Mucilaginibacter sp.]
MGNRRALIISPSYDGEKFEYLQGGNSLGNFLTHQLEGKGHYEVKHLKGTVSKALFRVELASLLSVGAGGQLLIFFYGHGVIQNNLGVFVTSDAENMDSGVSMYELAIGVSMSAASEVIVILDCCHAAAALKSSFETINLTITNSPGRVFLAACNEKQSAYEAPHPEYGLLGKFSAAVIDAISGKVRSVIGSEGIVRGSSIGRYLTEKITAWDQTSVFQAFESGDRLCIITRGFHTFEDLEPTGGESSDCMVLGVPFKPSLIFEGRDAELNTLIDTILVGSNVAVCATIEGLGGIGKTELTLQFIYHAKIQKHFSTVIWIDASGAIEAQWENITQLLSIRVETPSIEVIIRDIGRALNQRGKALIIIDNANQWNEISHLFPNNIPLLVTTRTVDFGGTAFKHQELSFLTTEAAKKILLSIEPKLESDEQIPELVQRLEGHALAIELAGLTIKTLGISISDYLTRLKNHQGDLQNVIQKTKHQRTVEQCLFFTWDRLSDAAKQLWIYAAMFAPVSASRELLHYIYKGSEQVSYQIEDIASYEDVSLKEQLRYQNNLFEFGFDEAYTELYGYGILSRVEGQTRDNQWWNMHRLVRDFSINKISRFHRLWYLLNISEWTRVKSYLSENEIPHVVNAILDSAQHLGNLNTSLGDRSLHSEISFRTSSKRGISYDPLRLLNYVEGAMKSPKVISILAEGISNPNTDVQLQAIELLKYSQAADEFIEPLITNLGSHSDEVKRVSLDRLLNLAEDNQQTGFINLKVLRALQDCEWFVLDFITSCRQISFWDKRVLDQLSVSASLKTNAGITARILIASYLLEKNENSFRQLMDHIVNIEIKETGTLVKVLSFIDSNTSPKINEWLVNLASSKDEKLHSNLIDTYVRLQSPVFLKPLLHLFHLKEASFDLDNLIDSLLQFAETGNRTEIEDAFIQKLGQKDLRCDDDELDHLIEVAGKLNLNAALPSLRNILGRSTAGFETISKVIVQLTNDGNKAETISILADVVKNNKVDNYELDPILEIITEYRHVDSVQPLLKRIKKDLWYAEKLITTVAALVDENNQTEIEQTFLAILKKNDTNDNAVKEIYRTLIILGNKNIAELLYTRIQTGKLKGSADKEWITLLTAASLNGDVRVGVNILELLDISLNKELLSVIRDCGSIDDLRSIVRQNRLDHIYSKDLLKLVMFLRHNFLAGEIKKRGLKQYLESAISNVESSLPEKNAAVFLYIARFHECGEDCVVGVGVKNVLGTEIPADHLDKYWLFALFHPVPFDKIFLEFLSADIEKFYLTSQLIEFYLNDKINDVKFFLDYLGKNNILFQEAQLISYLFADTVGTQVTAATALGLSKADYALPQLLGLTKSEEKSIQAAALDAIIQINPADLSSLLKQLLSEKLPNNFQEEVHLAAATKP